MRSRKTICVTADLFMLIKGERVGVLFDAGGRNSHVTVLGARKAPSQLSEEPKFSCSRVLIYLTKPASEGNNVDPNLKDDRKMQKTFLIRVTTVG